MRTRITGQLLGDFSGSKPEEDGFIRPGTSYVPIIIKPDGGDEGCWPEGVNSTRSIPEEW